MPHLKDLIHICLEPEVKGCGMTFDRFYVGSKYPHLITYRGKWLYLFCCRCISKFNVILKGLEKLMKWELERTSLSVNPLHKTQHAYSRVYNVDTALAQVVDEAEKGPLRNSLVG